MAAETIPGIKPAMRSSVDHQNNTRRDEGGKGAAGCHHTGRQTGVVAELDHFRDGDPPHDGSRSRAGACAGCKTGAPENGGDGYPAGEMPDPCPCGIEDIIGQTGIESIISHDDEKGNHAQ